MNRRVSRSSESRCFTSAEFTLLGNLDLGLIPARKPTRLFPLEPIGLDTPFVEGLASYIAELAAEHSITVRNLVLQELIPLATWAMVRDVDESGSLGKQFDYWNSINGMATVAKEMAKALQIATKIEGLESLTTAWLEGYVSSVICSTKRRWCSECLEEFRRCGRVFEPLLWSLSGVDACPLHYRILDKICPECLRQSMILENYLRPGFCPHCGTWLGRCQDFEKDRSITADSMPVKTSLQIGSVLEKARSLPSCNSEESVVVRNLRRCIEIVAHGNVCAFSEVSGISVHILHFYLGARYRPRLEILARAAVRVGIPLLSLFEMSLGASDGVWMEAAARLDERMRHRIHPNHESVKEHLERALKEDPPPRLWAVAKRLGYASSDRLRIIDSDLASQVHLRFLSSVRNGQQLWRSSTPISKRVDIAAALHAALAKECPDSVTDLARQMGYAKPSAFRSRYRELCLKISAKRKMFFEAQIASVEDVLRQSLIEDPPPTLTEISRRVRKSDTVIREMFPELCGAIVDRNQRYREHKRGDVAAAVDHLLIRTDLTLRDALSALGISRSYFMHGFPELYRKIAIRCRELENTKKQAHIRCADELIAAAVERLAVAGSVPSLKDVMSLLPKGPYLWKERVSLVLRTCSEQSSDS